MKINFTKREYRLLLDLLYLADWVIHAYESDEADDSQPYSMLVQKIYAFASQMECADLIEADTKTNQYYPTRHFEETSGVFDLIDEYDDHSFWDALVERLVDRDIGERVPQRERARMSAEEFFSMAGPIIEKYEEAFHRDGLSKLKLET